MDGQGPGLSGKIVKAESIGDSEWVRSSEKSIVGDGGFVDDEWIAVVIKIRIEAGIVVTGDGEVDTITRSRHRTDPAAI